MHICNSKYNGAINVWVQTKTMY